ncbi:MAG TPA: cytochrome c [Gaiellaceae bacterium]|nr:cytochrome c [Gaiellaceae bacterium]
MRRLPLLALTLLLTLVLAACGGSEERDTSPEDVQGETPTTETQPEDDGNGEDDGGGGEGDAEAGAALFEEQGCGSCHVLADAGSTGTTGPNLDEAQPSYDAAFQQIQNGGGGMPAYDGLGEDAIADLAAYVSERAGG